MIDEPACPIEGTWDGLYAYQGAQEAWPPAAFTATFTGVPDSNDFEGTIVDDQGIGEASAVGVIEGARVRFTKVYYRARSRMAAPISYEGTLSDDGRRMAGGWSIDSTALFGLIRRRAFGTWEAQRRPPGSPGRGPGRDETVWPPPHAAG